MANQISDFNKQKRRRGVKQRGKVFIAIQSTKAIHNQNWVATKDTSISPYFQIQNQDNAFNILLFIFLSQKPWVVRWKKKNILGPTTSHTFTT